MKILIAIDSSQPSQHAVEEAVRLLPGVLKDADVLLVDVLPRINPVELVDTGYAPLELEEAVLKQESIEAEGSLHQTQRFLALAGVRAKLAERLDEPATGILAVAQEFQPDLIVLGAHGRGPLMRLLKGSISESVIHHWPGAVLLVHGGSP